jgi:hypothetical protein
MGGGKALESLKQELSRRRAARLGSKPGAAPAAAIGGDHD